MAQKIGDLLTADGVRLADVEFPLWRVDDKCERPELVDAVCGRRDSGGNTTAYAHAMSGACVLGTNLYQYQSNAYRALAEREKGKAEHYKQLAAEAQRAHDMRNTTPQE